MIRNIVDLTMTDTIIPSGVTWPLTDDGVREDTFKELYSLDGINEAFMRHRLKYDITQEFFYYENYIKRVVGEPKPFTYTDRFGFKGYIKPHYQEVTAMMVDHLCIRNTHSRYPAQISAKLLDNITDEAYKMIKETLDTGLQFVPVINAITDPVIYHFLRINTDCRGDDCKYITWNGFVINPIYSSDSKFKDKIYITLSDRAFKDFANYKLNYILSEESVGPQIDPAKSITIKYSLKFILNIPTMGVINIRGYK